MDSKSLIILSRITLAMIEAALTAGIRLSALGKQIALDKSIGLSIPSIINNSDLCCNLA